MVTCGNKAQGNYQHWVPFTSTFSPPRPSPVRSGSFFEDEATRTERSAEYSILVVNDDPDQLELMRILLHKSGYHILTATDGYEGYDVAFAERPNLVISDVSMPRMNGIEMCGLIRENEYLKRTPVLLISAVRKDSESAVQGLKAGADDYLEAPYDPIRLVAKVSQLIERRRGEESLRESEERYRVMAETRLLLASIVESSDDAIISENLDGQITSWNAGAEIMFGYTAEEAIGQSISLVIPADRVPEPTEIHERIQRGEHLKQLETVRLRNDGTRIDVSVSISPIK